MIKMRLFFLLIALSPASMVFSQISSVTVSSMVKNKTDKTAMPYVSVVIKTEKDSAFISGTITNEEGRFSISNLKPGNYFIEVSFMGFISKKQPLFIGSLSAFIDLPLIELEEAATTLAGITVTRKVSEVSSKMDRKTYCLQTTLAKVEVRYCKVCKICRALRYKMAKCN